MIALMIFSLISVLPLILAIPNGPPWNRDRDHCLSDQEASFLVNVMVSFSVSFDPNYAGQFLADDFTVQSDSINLLLAELTGSSFQVCWTRLLCSSSLTFEQEGALTAPNKRDFLAASYELTTSAVQPPITVENIMHSCDEIAFRWVTTAAVPVQGIDILYIRKGSNLIEKDYSEFNNLADVVSAGAFPCKKC